MSVQTQNQNCEKYLEEAKELLKTRLEMKKPYVYVVNYHGSTIWKFRAEDLLAWLEGKYDMYVNLDLYKIIVISERGIYHYTERYYGPDVSVWVEQITAEKAAWLIRKYKMFNDKCRIVQLMAAYRYLSDVFGRSSNVVEVKFP